MTHLKRAKHSANDDAKKYPNLTAQREWDRAEHVRRAIAAGMTKKEAEKHADEEMAGDDA